MNLSRYIIFINFLALFSMTSEVLCLHTFILNILTKKSYPIFGIFSYILGGSAFSSPGVSEVDNSYETVEKNNR